MNDLIASLGVIIVGGAMLAFAARRAERWERSLFVICFVAHIAAAVAQVLITREYYGYGDMLVYFYNGRLLADMMSRDFTGVAPDVLQLVLQRPDNPLPIEEAPLGTSSASMSGLAGFVLLGLGDSLYGLCLLVALSSFAGKLLLYWALRDNLPREYAREAALASLLVPSVVFWSSGFLKESVATAALGPLVFAVTSFLNGQRARGALLGLPSALTIGFIKPYILFPVALGVAAWIYTRRAARAGRTIALRPVPIAAATLMMVLLLSGLGRVFPEYAVDKVAEKTSEQQALGAQVEVSGSRYQLGNVEQKTLAGQLAFAPLALVTALFRPFVFEAKNPLMFLNGLETAVIAYFFLLLITRRRLATLIGTVLKTPMLSFSAVASLTFSLAVGLASSNLGTLSRYRMPLFPLFILVLLVGQRRAAEQGAEVRPA